MITRIEIDGFKSFEDFALDLPPFLVLIGTNASGKSNLLDALNFLATAATRGLSAAVGRVRGDARGLFRLRGDGSRVDRMRFAAEFLLPGLVEGCNRWRYEVEFRWAEPAGALEGITVEAQRLIAMAVAADRWPDAVRMHEAWRTEEFLRYVPDATAYEWRAVEIGDFYSMPVRRDALLSVLSVGLWERTGDEEVHLFPDFGPAQEIGKEFSQARFLHLEAGCLREPSEFGGPDTMEPTGEDLPNYLRALARRTATPNRPLGVVGDIKMHLTGLVREISDFEIIEDRRRRDVRLEFSSPYASGLGTEFASDGTLRMLAILAAMHDAGLTAVEEPENGVFPERLRQLLGLARELVADLSAPPESPAPPVHGQILFTSHSPVVLDAVPYENIAFLDMTTVLEEGAASRVTRVRRLREDAGAVRVPGERWPRVTDSELDRFRAGLEEPV